MKLINDDFKNINYSNFDVIICDPPWDYNDKSPKVSKEQVIYNRWNNKDGLEFIFSQEGPSYIFMWVTNSMLEDVFKTDYKKYNWEYKQILTWLKTTPKGNISYGLGHNWRNCTEHLLLFIRKKYKPLHFNKRNFIKAQSNKRTCKPKDFEYNLIKDLEDKGKKVCYIFSGYNLDKFQDLNIECIDIFDNK